MSKKSNLDEDGYNVENSNQIDNHLGGDSTIGQDYKDLFSSRVVEINNELIKLKGENEKVVKMKSEYQKLTRKLKLEIEEFNERREKELKRLKLESDEFEERRDRETKKLKLDMEEFYEKKERELREIEEMREDETKKIQREKKQLERSMKLNLSIGNRKDKEEIESLKAQIAKITEDSKFKENTNKLLIERLRRQLEEANNKITTLNKTIDNLKANLIINKKKVNVSNSAVRLSRTKSETKSQTQGIKKTSSVKELTNKPKESKPIQQAKNLSNEVELQFYKTEVPKLKTINITDEIQGDLNSSTFDLVFLEKYHPKPNSLANKVAKTDKTNDGKLIKVYEDGRREIIFSSGVRKEIHLDGYEIVYFTNKDIKQVKI
jgi:centromere protein J